MSFRSFLPAQFFWQLAARDYSELLWRRHQAGQRPSPFLLERSQTILHPVEWQQNSVLVAHVLLSQALTPCPSSAKQSWQPSPHQALGDNAAAEVVLSQSGSVWRSLQETY